MKVGLEEQQTAGRKALLSANCRCTCRSSPVPTEAEQGGEAMSSKDRNRFFSRQNILGNHLLQVTISQIKNQAKLPTGSCISCNFSPNTWLGVRCCCLLNAILVSHLFRHLCPNPWTFFFISWIMLMFQRKIPKN